jgi:hypothetical protein
MTTNQVSLTVALGLALITTPSCRKDEPVPVPPAPSASAVPLDHLGPGELRQGKESMYGLVLPDGMSIIARYADAMSAAGNLRPEHVANYVRERVVVSRVELGAARTIFPSAKIRDGDAQRTYQVEVVSAAENRTVLEIHDVTPPRKTEGLTNEQRLKQVGLRPDGKMLEPSKME